MNDYAPEELKQVPEFKFEPFLECVRPLADSVEVSTGIFHLVPMVQSAHESRNGNSGLARNHCNLFGIVATDSWKKKGGDVALMPTWEVIGGKRVDMNREFRKYKSWAESFSDWAQLITGLNVYKRAYELLKDKNTVIQGIEEMGKVYATDPGYAHKLIELYRVAIKSEEGA